MDAAPVLNVVGEQVALGPLRRDLLPAYHRWSNDLAAADRLGGLPRPVTLEGQAAWYDHEATQVTFTIYERAGWRAIGGCSLIEVDHRAGTARLAILIGEADARGRGYGTEAVRLLLDVAFTALGLHSVMLGVWEFNRAGRRAYEKAGFRECGRRREACRLGGRRWDEILMDCLATECASPVLGGGLRPRRAAVLSGQGLAAARAGPEYVRTVQLADRPWVRGPEGSAPTRRGATRSRRRWRARAPGGGAWGRRSGMAPTAEGRGGDGVPADDVEEGSEL